MPIKIYKIILYFFAIILSVSFLIGYFLPYDIGWCGESPVIKFRFQVAEYDSHSYGESSIWEILFETNIEKIAKYGDIDFHEKIGGIKEYFGLKEIKCSFGGAQKI